MSTHQTVGAQQAHRTDQTPRGGFKAAEEASASSFEAPKSRLAKVGSLKPWVLACLVGILIATATIAIFQITEHLRISISFPHAFTYTIPTLLVLLGLTILLVGPSVWRSVRYQATRSWKPNDILLISVSLGLITAPHWSETLGNTKPAWSSITTQLGLLIGVIAIGRWVFFGLDRVLRRLRTPQRTPEGELLDRVVGTTGMEPLPDIDANDLLDRLPFVDTLEAVVRHPREHSLTFGLNGPWGSGKTTILRALAKRLEAREAIVVRFDAWAFREPERIVGNYISQLARALRRAGGGPSLRTQLRRLGLGIAPLTGSRLSEAINALLTIDEADSIHEMTQELRTALRNQRRLVVVIVDDLDRLERNEIHAALRTLRLLGDLPRLVHVLAYDRRQIARALFPEDDSGQSARDYLSKIVHVELSISTPTPEATLRILDLALNPLLSIVSSEEVERFEERLRSIPTNVFVEALPTPREVRRVIAATALLWPRLQRDVNLFDLFILQVIHSRFPTIFSVIHSHPEWFTEQQWSGNLWRISEGERWRGEAAEYVKALWASTDPDAVNAARLLKLVFPVADQGQHSRLQETDCRRERRICHPDVFPRYFQLSVPREKISESSVEDLADTMRSIDPSMIATVVQHSVEGSARTGRAAALFDQWDMFVQRLGPENQALPIDLVRSVALGVSRATTTFSTNYNDPLNPIRRAVQCILHLVTRTRNSQEATDVLVAVIRESRFAVSGLLVYHATHPDKNRGFLRDRALDERSIRNEFDSQVQKSLSVTPSPLFGLSDDDIVEVLYRTQERDICNDVFARALKEHPEQLPRILSFTIKLSANSSNPDDVHVYDDALPNLNDRLDLNHLNGLSEHLQIDYWQDPQERALVHYFRKRYKIVLHEAEQTRRESEEAEAKVKRAQLLAKALRSNE